METALSKAFLENGVSEWGICSFEQVQDCLLPCRAAARLPKEACSVILALFPYRFPEDGQPRNLSRYAAVNDYHTAAATVMERVAEVLRREGAEAAVFCDNSPIPEVYAAAVSGLGVIGDNGLLLNDRFGSYVFIAEIVTDLALPHVDHPVRHCGGCSYCREACPARCIGLAEKATRCISAVTQKKGDLSEEERQLIKTGGFCWGCDRCQEVCPHNRQATVAPHPCFTEYVPWLTAERISAANLREKPYGWRGPEVLKRNLEILDET